MASLQTWRQKLAVIQEWSGVERACIPAGVVGVCFLQYAAWGLFALAADHAGQLIDRTAILDHILPVLAVIAGSLGLVLLGLFLRRRQPEAEWFQHLAANYYGLTLVWGGYLIGPLSFTTGIVLTGAPILGFLLLPRRVMFLAIPAAFVTMLALNLATAWDVLPYAPLLAGPRDAASALLWTHSQLFFAAPHVIVNTLLCAALLGQWRKREAGVLTMSLTDALTQVHNRRSILSLLETELVRAQRSGAPVAAVLLDLDHFKRINDTWGHPVGDRVLQEAARVLRGVIRRSDDLGRYGGEEFLLLLPDTPLAGALALAEHCRARLSRLVVTADNGEEVPVSASFGVAVGTAVSVEALVHAADEALYAAKAGGRNRVVAGTVADAAPAPVARAPAASWQGRLRQLSVVLESGFAAGFGERDWWRSPAGWRRRIASVREWSPVAKAGLVVVLLAGMIWGGLLWVLALLHQAGAMAVDTAAGTVAGMAAGTALIDVAAGRQLAWLMAGELVAAHLLVATALWLRRRAPDARWFQHLALHFYSLSLVAVGYMIGMFYLPTGVILTASPMLGFLLFRRSVVVPVFLTALACVIALAYAGALGWLPYAPLVSPEGPAWQRHDPFWVYSTYVFYLPTLLVVLVLAAQILGRWREREAHIRALSLTDALTRVHNRRSILERLEREAERSARHGAPLTLALLDLDHFKRINDTWGHPTGDRVLREAARALKDVVREADLVGRYGGEEFLLLLPDTSLDGGLALLERCRERLAGLQVRADNGEAVPVSASFGATCCEPGQAVRVAVLTKAADDALYRAKRAGRNRVEVQRLPPLVPAAPVRA